MADLKTIHAKVSSLDDLRQMSAERLEEQANLMLYGTPKVLEAAMEREIFRRLYVPRNLNKPLIYVRPKIPALGSKLT